MSAELGYVFQADHIFSIGLEEGKSLGIHGAFILPIPEFINRILQHYSVLDNNVSKLYFTTFFETINKPENINREDVNELIKEDNKQASSVIKIKSPKNEIEKI